MPMFRARAAYISAVRPLSVLMIQPGPSGDQAVDRRGAAESRGNHHRGHPHRVLRLDIRACGEQILEQVRLAADDGFIE